MNAQEAHKALKDMDCIQEMPFGWFIVHKAPRSAKQFPLFIKAIKTLGAWCVTTPTSPNRVECSTGAKPNEIMFRLPN